MKTFWTKRLKLVAIYIVISHLFILAPKVATGVVITLPVYLGAFLAIFVSTIIFFVLPSLGMVWMFKRIAKNQGVDIEGVIFALYTKKWDFNRVAYDKNFPRDLQVAWEDWIQKEQEKEKQKWMDRWFPGTK